MLIPLDTCKLHLGIIDDSEDDLITDKMLAAQAHLERRLGYTLAERYPIAEEIPEDLREAMLSLMAHYYENREGTLVGVTGQTTPLSVIEIIRAYRDFW